MASFRDKQWSNMCKKGDLTEVLLNKESMDEVRRMCKVLAPFFAMYDANGDNAIDFEEFRMIFKEAHENSDHDVGSLVADNLFGPALAESPLQANSREYERKLTERGAGGTGGGENLSREAQYAMFDAADTAPTSVPSCVIAGSPGRSKPRPRSGDNCNADNKSSDISFEVAGGYHGPVPSRYEEEEVGSLKWLLKEAEVTWYEHEPAHQRTREAVKKEELDGCMQEYMVQQRFSERVSLRRRVEVIHKGGSPEIQESCAALARGCCALPLLTCAAGVRAVAEPIRTCWAEGVQQCSRMAEAQAGPEAQSERLYFSPAHGVQGVEMNLTHISSKLAGRRTNHKVQEFVACLMSFALDPNTDLQETKKPKYAVNPNKYLEDGEGSAEGEDDEEEDVPEDLADLEPEEQQKRIKTRAAYQMALGTLLVLVFSDPMVDLLAELGKRLDVSAFYISFVLAPLASNASELVAAYNYAKKRTCKSITTSLSTLEGAAIMNNTFCLGIFLGLVWPCCKKAQGMMCAFGSMLGAARDAAAQAWEFSAETTSILLIEASAVCDM
ncbi:NCL1 [Symbiodinium sp. CCMP2456]|nr:NCL1 [Symbiodinium sp. CCMP2456]